MTRHHGSSRQRGVAGRGYVGLWLATTVGVVIAFLVGVFVSEGAQACWYAWRLRSRDVETTLDAVRWLLHTRSFVAGPRLAELARDVAPSSVESGSDGDASGRSWRTWEWLQVVEAVAVLEGRDGLRRVVDGQDEALRRQVMEFCTRLESLGPEIESFAIDMTRDPAMWVRHAAGRLLLCGIRDPSPAAYEALLEALLSARTSPVSRDAFLGWLSLKPVQPEQAVRVFLAFLRGGKPTEIDVAWRSLENVSRLLPRCSPGLREEWVRILRELSEKEETREPLRTSVRRALERLEAPTGSSQKPS